MQSARELNRACPKWWGELSVANAQGMQSQPWGIPYNIPCRPAAWHWAGGTCQQIPRPALRGSSARSKGEEVNLPSRQCEGIPGGATDCAFSWAGQKWGWNPPVVSRLVIEEGKPPIWMPGWLTVPHPHVTEWREMGGGSALIHCSKLVLTML